MMAGSCLGEDRKPQMEIDLEGTTDDIVPPLTQSLNLTCSLVPATGKDPKDKKADFKTITGVYINLKALGSEEEADAAKISISDPDNATLSGLLPRATIMGSSLSEGFINVGVAAPHINHAGEYTCKVIGINTAGDPVILTHKASVQLYKDPEVVNLAKYVHKLELQLEKKIASQDENVASQISNIKTKYQNQETDIYNIETKNRNQDTDITNIKTKNQNQETDIYNIETKNQNQDTDITNIKTRNWKQDTEINKRVSKADIQQGRTVFYPGIGRYTEYRQITFPHRYSKAPKVFLSVRQIYGNESSDTDDNTGSEYKIHAYPVTQTGFRLQCTVYKYSYINQMSVYWIAFPSP